MKIQRTIPPAAAMISFRDLFHGMTGFLFGTSYLRELEKGIKTYFGVKHVFLVSSGKAALSIILKALHDLSPEKSEVLIPAYTCYSVPSAIVKAGLKVALCDIKPGTFDFDSALLEDTISDKTLCVIPTHLFGIPANVERVNAVCRRRGIFVVEDAAQAMGGHRNGKKLGTLGDAGFFSLGRGKNITCGSGGIIVTNDDRIAAAVRKEYARLEYPSMLQNSKELIEQLIMKIFIQPNLFWVPAGIPSLKLGRTIFYRDFPVERLSGVKAGMLRCWQGRLNKTNQIRQEAGASYRRELSLTVAGEEDAVPYLRFPVLARDREMRDSVYARAKTYGVGLMYPAPVNEIVEIQDGFSGKSFPVAKAVAEKLVTFPTHALVAREDKAAMYRAVNDGHFVSARNPSNFSAEEQGA